MILTKKNNVITLEMSEKDALALAKVLSTLEGIHSFNSIEKSIIENLPEALLSLIAEV
jgi:hypothetical protein